MKKIIFPLFFLGISLSVCAQVIEGTIYDAGTKETIPGVAVYFNGTSFITTSDNEGKFRLVVENKIYTELVFSHISYEILMIQKPFEHRELSFYMQEKVNTLDEVRVTADRYSRAAKMKVFKEQFLGDSMAGKFCVILNEEDIILNYNHATNTLEGYANRPIVVENRYLAYHVTFDLSLFYVHYSEDTLHPDKAVQIAFKGTSSFIDNNPYNVLYSKRRDGLFFRSSHFFWRSFVHHSLEENDLRIYNRSRRIEPSQYFAISDLPTQKRVQILPNTNINLKPGIKVEAPVYGVIRVIYSNTIRSEIVFLTHSFSVDMYGNPDPIDGLIYSGAMGEQRIGDMLPQDYKQGLFNK